MSECECVPTHYGPQGDAVALWSHYVYYVDQTLGNDANGGRMPDDAWQTIDKVNATTLLPGDTVLFRRGEAWTGTMLDVPSSGSEGNPITFGAYGSGDLPLIEGGIGGVQRVINCVGRSYVDFEYLDIRGVANYGFDIQGSEIVIRDCVVSDCVDDNISIGPNAHDVLVKNTISHDPYRVAPGPTISCIEIQDGAYNITVQDCECYGSEEVGININGHDDSVLPYNITIQDCYCHDNISNGIVISNGAIALPLAPLVVIDRCTCTANGGRGVDIYGGIGVPAPANVTVRDCILSGNTSYQVRIRGDGHSYYRNLLSEKTCVYIENATDLGFYNNTIYNTIAGAVLAIDGTDNAGTSIKNNVVYTSIEAWPVIQVAAGAQAGLDIDYNLYFHPGGVAAGRWNWLGPDLNWANWLLNSGQDANSPTPADPLFTNPAGDDFTLQAGSPAINAGVDVGLPFCGVAPDCGAYEYCP